MKLPLGEIAIAVVPKGDKGTRGQGDKGTRGQGDKGTRGEISVPRVPIAHSLFLPNSEMMRRLGLLTKPVSFYANRSFHRNFFTQN